MPPEPERDQHRPVGEPQDLPPQRLVGHPVAGADRRRARRRTRASSPNQQAQKIGSAQSPSRGGNGLGTVSPTSALVLG